MTPTTVPLRSPDCVMRLDRLGAMHATRLSFAPTLLRLVLSEGWRITRPLWALDEEGFGQAIYGIETPTHRYSLVCFSQPLEPEQRTDRVIAEAWDTSYVLYDGVPDADALARLAREVPRQEAGRFTETELVLSRANRSVRLFETVVACLADGRQPSAAVLDAVGYLMRTTAVYGNGKFGIADRDVLADRPGFGGPFRAEMLTVWLIRGFTLDLVDHCAAAKGSARAVRLAPALRRRLGVGNSTGLGMAPFLVRHPVLLHRWMLARETALARVRAHPVEARAWTAFVALLDETIADLPGWRTGDAAQADRIAGLSADLVALAAHVAGLAVGPARTWDAIYRWAEAHLGLEAQEKLVSLLIEPHGGLVDDLAAAMSADERESWAVEGHMRCGALRRLIETTHAWALDAGLDEAAAQARFWYVSAEKLEPRLGERWSEPGAEREQPLTFGRDVQALHRALLDVPPDTALADYLADHPGQRHVVRRVQIAARHPYAEIRDNLIGAAMRPIDLLRCKLSFLGAKRFDPRSDRWLRIALFQDAIVPDEVTRPLHQARDAA